MGRGENLQIRKKNLEGRFFSWGFFFSWRGPIPDCPPAGVAEHRFDYARPYHDIVVTARAPPGINSKFWLNRTSDYDSNAIVANDRRGHRSGNLPLAAKSCCV